MPPRKNAKPRANGASGDFLDILRKNRPVETVEVEPFGTVYVRAISAGLAASLVEQCRIEGKDPDSEDAYDNQKFVAMVTAAALTDEKGNRLIAPGDEAALADAVTPGTFNALQAAALRLNRLDGSAAGNA